jgi:uncharacterized membrane protein YkvA (DUF1232 family)
MDDGDLNYLDSFAAWLSSLGSDAERFAQYLADSTDKPESARSAAAAGLNYLFKSLDLIPDGIDDIGYLDDAFVLRTAAAQIVREGGSDRGPIAQLAGSAAEVRGFLGENFARLDRYVMGLRTGAARGRTVREIVGSDQLREDFVTEVRAFASAYQTPAFTHDPKTLIKLRAFFEAKLPK